jgi:hypothetical protein
MFIHEERKQTKIEENEIGRVETHASTNRAHSHLVSVAGSGLRGGSLGLGGNDPLLVKILEERLENVDMSDLSTLKWMNQSSFSSNQKRKSSHTRKAGSWSQRMKRDLNE